MKPSPANDNLIEQTRRLWRSRLGRDVSCDDAPQIAENVTGFFAVLAEWSNAERTAPYQGCSIRLEATPWIASHAACPVWDSSQPPIETSVA